MEVFGVFKYSRYKPGHWKFDKNKKKKHVKHTKYARSTLEWVYFWLLNVYTLLYTVSMKYAYSIKKIEKHHVKHDTSTTDITIIPFDKTIKFSPGKNSRLP